MAVALARPMIGVVPSIGEHLACIRGPKAASSVAKPPE
jgi:hypothetical protein